MERNIFGFILNTQRTQVVCFTLSLLAIIVYILLEAKYGAGFRLWDMLEPIMGVSTFAAAAAVWFGETKQDWENSLPKRLTARFAYKFGDEYRIVMQCQDAYLAGEADIRTWGQQLGFQMAGEKIRFQPYIYQSEVALVENVKRYEVTFVLNELPNEDSLGLTYDGRQIDPEKECFQMTFDRSRKDVKRETIPQILWVRPEY
jgi:hypothetical protein